MQDGQDNSHSLADKVCQRLRDAIIRGELKPGERILELKVARENEVSQAPVREALLRLKEESLVVSSRYKGTFVSSFSLKEVNDLYALRAVMDEFAFGRALENVTEAEIERLEELYNDIEKTALNMDVEGLWQADIAFHDFIYELADHETLYSMWKMICQKLSRGWYLTNQAFYPHLSDIARLHYPLVETLRDRDASRIKAANDFHLSNIRERLKALVEQTRQQEAPPDA